MEIKFKKLTETAQTPTKADSGAAGYDLYADIPRLETIDIESNETDLISTGLALEIPNGYWCGIYARSGLAVNQKIRLANCVAVIDSSYRGEIKIPLHNDANIANDNTRQQISHGDRIAQLIIHKCEEIEFTQTDEMSDTERGTGGFGSTGT